MSRHPSLFQRIAFLAAFAFLSSCHSAADNLPGDSSDHRPWQDIAPDETVRFTGTEPFWGGEVAGSRLTWSTPDNPLGTVVEVSRFAGRGGLSFSGEMGGKALTMTITPGDCSDGMSDYRYPFGATVRLGDELRQGCGWTERQPRTGAK